MSEHNATHAYVGRCPTTTCNGWRYMAVDEKNSGIDKEMARNLVGLVVERVLIEDARTASPCKCLRETRKRRTR